jgi:2-polyprenyl-3-methyl-5-hydroxy-6-metoxy-1,4-benzoquinol methylase
MTVAERRSCPLCGETANRPLLSTRVRSSSGERYRVVTCAACSLRYTDPLPTDEELNRLYEEEYYEYAYDRPCHDLATGVDGKVATRNPGRFNLQSLTLIFKAVLFAERRRALLGRQPGRVLDVGCGNGDFLRSLKRRGWDVHGIEFSVEATELARAKGITVHRGQLTSAAYPASFFDVVTLWHVAEHLPDPLTEFAEVQRILRDDGLFVLEVPNSDCLTRRLCGTRWSQLDVPRHLQHFTPATLDRALAQTGFTSERRRNFHLVDFTLAFYSFVDRLGISRISGIRFFSTDFEPAPPRSKILFLALGVPIACFCIPYSVIEALVGGNGENLTVTAHKAAT